MSLRSDAETAWSALTAPCPSARTRRAYLSRNIGDLGTAARAAARGSAHHEARIPGLKAKIEEDCRLFLVHVSECDTCR